MPIASEMRQGLKGFGLCGAALLALGGPSQAAGDLPGFVTDGHAGFVVSDIAYALAKDAKESGACPDGMTHGFPTFEEVTAAQKKKEAAQGQAAQGNDDKPSQAQLVKKLIEGFPSVDGQNLCMHPELGKPDPNFKTVTGSNIPVYGIDIDGRDSHADGKPAPGTCAHDDFVGMNGEKGIDNQFYRVVGCSPSFQSTGQSNTFAVGMLTGSWGILITLDGVDDIQNDDDVTVGLYANADPIQLGPDRKPLANATYAMTQDPRFRATTKGRIKDGVLTTDPVDVDFNYDVNSIYLERPLHEARVRMTLSADGTLEGYLAGYASVDEMYDVQYGFRNGKNAKGEPADMRLKLISSNGQGAVQGHSCNGAYFALQANADAHPDPKTGKCNWISTQYRITAIPAFVVDEATESANEELVK